MRLILNGDDFGISHGVNLAMIDCFKDGVMTSCSMMTNMPYAKEAAQLMKLYPDLSVGIHFNLTVGKPLTPNLKTLVKEDGTFNKGNLKDSKNVDPTEIEIELQAQMDRFIELCGHKPTHINSHHGIELIQGAEKVVCAFAKRYDLPVRRFFTLPKGNHPDLPFEVPLAKFIFKPTPTLPCDLISCFTEEEISSDDIFEFPLHPGYVDSLIMELSSLTTGRAYDAHVFNCQEIKDWIKNNSNIHLVDYSTCKKI